MTIVEYFENPVIIPNKSVTYIYADALTECDCGATMVLTQTAYGNSTYKGSCLCGKKWELLNNKLKCVNHE